MSLVDKIKKLLSKLVFKSKIYLYLLNKKFFSNLLRCVIIMKKKIILFISGKGSNAINIINYFSKSSDIKVSNVYCNNNNSPFLKYSLDSGIKVSNFSNDELSTKVFDELKLINPNLIVLAGFLKKIPPSFINYFNKKIVNIHPSLLPKYGGRGMYGSIIHNKVIENNEIETGISIHYVSENYDSGEIIFQKKIQLNRDDTAETVEKKIHILEYEFYPQVIQSLLNE